MGKNLCSAHASMHACMMHACMPACMHAGMAACVHLRANRDPFLTWASAPYPWAWEDLPNFLTGMSFFEIFDPPEADLHTSRDVFC